MDTTKTITHVGLCAGYGGIELGLKRVLPTLRTVALCEIEAFAIANMVAKMEAGLMDPAPVWTDLKTFPWAEFRDRVDILTGGYPCQPFSAAGKRLGADDPRHLWPHIAGGIRLLRPRLCFFENVEGHISLGLRDVLRDLGELGYRATWGIFSASEVGAPHQRKRVFIMAHRSGEGLQRDIARLFVQSGRQMPSGSTAGSGGSSRSGELADSNSAGSGQDWESSQPRANSVEQSSCFERRGDAGEIRERQAWPSRPGEPQHAWEPPRVVGNAQYPRLERQRNDATSEYWRDEGVQLRPANGDNSDAGQTEPPLGGDANGTASGLDDAIVFAADCQPCECCDDVICWKCGGHYADCPCPGPNSSDD